MQLQTNWLQESPRTCGPRCSQELCDTATNEQWNDWYRRILIQDLRCGVSVKTVNGVAKGTVPIWLYVST